MHVDVIDSFEELLRLRGNWDAVYDADPEAQFYMSWTYISGWFKHLRPQWIILAAKETPDATAHVGFFPLQLRTEHGKDGAFHNELRTGGGYSTGYNGLICDPRFEGEIVQAFADQIKRLNWTRLHLENFFLSSKRLAYFLNEFHSSEFKTGKMTRPDDGDGIDHDIYVYVNLPNDFESFLSERLGAKTRANARRTLRQVDDGDEFRITHVTAQTLERDVDTLLKFWETQWAAKLAARYNPALPQGMMTNFRSMLKYCFEYGALFLPVLWQGDTAIGVQASFIDKKNGSLISLLNGRNLVVKRPPPGFALHLFSIRWATQNGFKIYDLQTGDFPYKYDFGGIERRIECFVVTTKDSRNLRDRLEPRSLPVVFARARALLKADKPEEALQACRQILETDPKHADAQQLADELGAKWQAALSQAFQKAAQLYQAGQMAAAEAIYRKILQAVPRHFDVTMLLGLTLLKQRKFDAAAQQFDVSAGIKPDAAAPYYNKGFALTKLGRLKDAVASFDAALARNPDDARTISLRAEVLRAMGSNFPRDIAHASGEGFVS